MMGGGKGEEAYEEIFRSGGRGVEVDGPVHEGLATADGEDDGVHVVDGDGFDDHCFCAVAPVCFDVGFSFFTGGAGVYALGILCCKAY